MEGSLGLRKGAWTAAEDNLLRKCIEKYGEGKWHQVPLKAGLNRCRKSCRLRWLNYLSPDIKRGKFSADEVDLLIRLHKLLGNRWSLIAGRLPGRTANDVKNYWNSHLRKKKDSSRNDENKNNQNIVKVNVIKPRARAFTKSLVWLDGKNCPHVDGNPMMEDNPCKPLMMSPVLDHEIMWWDSFLAGSEAEQSTLNCIGESQVNHFESFLSEDTASAAEVGDAFIEENVDNSWSFSSIDVDLWNILETDQEGMA